MFFSADHHFDHKNILWLEDRPFRTMDEMHLHMQIAWNSYVGDGDSVFYLGDFCLGTFPDSYNAAMKRLNGKHFVWLAGNHDVSMAKLNQLPRVTAMKSLIMPIHDIGNVLLSHKAIYDYDQSRIDLCIHGHIHSRYGKTTMYKQDGRHFFHVGVDTNDFKPWHVTEIARLYKRFRRNND